MDRPNVRSQVEILASLLEKANETTTDPIGRCEWTDINGTARCNNFSEFQCQQVSGSWTAGERC